MDIKSLYPFPCDLCCNRDQWKINDSILHQSTCTKEKANQQDDLQGSGNLYIINPYPQVLPRVRCTV